MQKENTYRAWLWIFVVIVLIAAVAAMIKLVSSASGQTGNGVQIEILSSVTPNEWVKGNASSTVTLIEYADFQCPACAAYHGAVKQLEKELGSQVRFIFRHFPLSQHANADISAQAAEAAGKQGKFWEMHDMIFENQNAWALKSDKDARAIFTGYAKKLGLNEALFITDLDSKISEEKIKQDYTQGIGFGVDSTPTFFLNNTKLNPPQSYEAFKQTILDEINAAAQ